MKYKAIIPAALVFSIVFLAACGQKGPLYLPGDTSTIQSTVPGQPQATVPGQPQTTVPKVPPVPVEESDEESEDQPDPNQ